MHVKLSDSWMLKENAFSRILEKFAEITRSLHRKVKRKNEKIIVKSK